MSDRVGSLSGTDLKTSQRRLVGGHTTAAAFDFPMIPSSVAISGGKQVGVSRCHASAPLCGQRYDIAQGTEMLPGAAEDGMRPFASCRPAPSAVEVIVDRSVRVSFDVVFLHVSSPIGCSIKVPSDCGSRLKKTFSCFFVILVLSLEKLRLSDRLTNPDLYRHDLRVFRG